jgi:hypothetical protein
MNTKGTLAPRPSAVEMTSAREAFEALRGEIEGLDAADVASAHVDVQLAAAVAHSVVQRDATTPARRAEFERLGKAGFYEPEALDRLPRIALAAWYARQQQVGRASRASAASVPEAVLREGQQLRGAMLRVLEHWLDDDADVASDLVMIRSGTGYQDLANDLEALAELYERAEVRKVIGGDHKHYRASDATDARRVARGIFQGLGLSQEGDAKRWLELTLRAWTLLFDGYEDHRAAGTFVFRKREAVAVTYPSLISSVRSAPSRRAAESPDESPDEPVTDAG